MIDFTAMARKAKAYNVILTEKQLSQLDCYAEMLVDWNNRMNLTSIVDSEGIMIRHFEDSLAVLRYISIPMNASLIDVGTGAGFPGMVLKIVRPDIRLTLLDSLNKRIMFLDEVLHQLQMTGTSVHMRAEEGSRKPEWREQFDFSCARAVSEMRELSELCLPYVKIGGKFFALKGRDVTEELNAARPGIGQLGGKVSGVSEYTISDGSERSLIIVDKIKPTPSVFPRTSAKIKKKPL